MLDRECFSPLALYWGKSGNRAAVERDQFLARATDEIAPNKRELAGSAGREAAIRTSNIYACDRHHVSPRCRRKAASAGSIGERWRGGGGRLVGASEALPRYGRA